MRTNRIVCLKKYLVAGIVRNKTMINPRGNYAYNTIS